MLRTMLNSDIYNLWFGPVRATALEGDQLTLEVANDFCEVWLKDNYLGLIQDVLMHAAGQQLKVRFVVGATATGATLTGESKAIRARALEQVDELPPSGRDLGFNPKNTFDTFVVGNNSFAHAAALAVAQAPGKSYNPLFLYGGVGLGKTHLLHAIGQHVAGHKKAAKVSYVSSEKFTNEYIDGIQKNQLVRFRKKYRQTDVLLIDDIQFLAHRIRTNIRRLEGALIRVASYAALTGKKLSLEVIENLLREVLHEEGRLSVSIESIQKKVAEHFDIRLADMISKRRPENIAFPRQIAMYLARHMTESSLNTIGEAFGGRDHGTVLHACRLVRDRMQVDASVRQ